MPEYTNNNILSQRTDEIEDIVGMVPPLLSKSIFFFIIGLLVLISIFAATFKYPETIVTSLKISPLHMPRPIILKMSGRLSKILVNENADVAIGDTLAYLENDASYSEVINLLTQLQKLKIKARLGQPITEDSFSEIDDTNLGELQIPYQHFFRKFLINCSLTKNGFYNNLKYSLKRDLYYLKNQQQYINKEIYEKHKNISLNISKKNSKGAELFDSKLNADSNQSHFLQSRVLKLETTATLTSLSLQISNKQREIFDIDNQIANLKLDYIQQLDLLINKVQEWNNKYILTAPQSGKVIFREDIDTANFFSLNQEVFYIYSKDKYFYGEILIPQSDLNKVKNGQNVYINLGNLSNRKHELINGKVEYVSTNLLKDLVSVKVKFEYKRNYSTIVANYLKPNSMVEAKIEIQNSTILQRIRKSIIKL